MFNQDISKKFKFNNYDAMVARKLIELEETPEAIIYFSKVCDKLSDYAYWYYLSTLWVSYTGYSDINLWKKLFAAKRKFKTISIMKPSEVEEFNKLNSNINAYRVHRKDEEDWIAYTLSLDVAKRFAKERNVDKISLYKIKKKDIEALFLRRGEQEVLLLNKEKAKFIKEITI